MCESYIKLFARAALREVVIECENTKTAEAMRFALYRVRRKMRKENHELLPIAETVMLSIVPGPTKDAPARLIASPYQSRFDEIIEKALADSPRAENSQSDSSPANPQSKNPYTKD